MHKHHIIPKHEGGTDFAENIVELTVTQHAMWHFAEWQRKGKYEDKAAWKSLAGLINQDERHRMLSSIGGKNNKGRRVSEETKQKIAETLSKKLKGKPSPQKGIKRRDGWNSSRKGMKYNKR